MHIFTGIQESTRCNGNIANGVSVEWKIEQQLHGLKHRETNIIYNNQ